MSAALAMQSRKKLRATSAPELNSVAPHTYALLDSGRHGRRHGRKALLVGEADAAHIRPRTH
jgi:hypothetical protein